MKYLWVVLIAISIAAAVWGNMAAEEGCRATGNVGGRVAVTLALLAIGVVALLPPIAAIRLLADRAILPLLSALWLLVWAAVWMTVWYTNLGCVD
jgi:hypothetical protein